MYEDTWDSHPVEEAWSESSELGPAHPPIGVGFVGSFEGRSLITLALRSEGRRAESTGACWFIGEVAGLLGLGGASELARRLAIDWADEAREGVHWLRIGELELAELQLALLERGVVLPPSLEQARTTHLLLEPGVALAVARTGNAGVGERLLAHLHERVLPDLQVLGRPSAAPHEREAAAIVRERLELERRRWEFETLDQLAERLELEGEVDDEVAWAYRVVAAEVALDGDLWQLKPSIEHGWLSPTEIARRHLGVTPARVGQVISLLGLRESRAHSKAVLNKAPGRERSVITHLYSPAAVGLIERELRSRGYRRVE